MNKLSAYKLSSNLAYAVGLLATDGNLSKDGRHICLSSSDKDLLKTFKDCLLLKSKISLKTRGGYSRKLSYRIQFSDVNFYRWLQKIGLEPAKTYTLGKIDIPNEFFRDFLRGHLDGDGTILTYLDRYNHYRGKTYVNQRVYTKFISVSPEHIRWLQQKIQSLLGIKGSINSNLSKKPNRVTIWILKFAKKESLKLLEWIYYKPNLPCLERKHIIAKKVLNRQ